MVGAGGGDGYFGVGVGEDDAEAFFAVGLLELAEEGVGLVVGGLGDEVDEEGDGGGGFEEFGDDFGGVEDGGAGEAEVGEEEVAGEGLSFEP